MKKGRGKDQDIPVFMKEPRDHQCLSVGESCEGVGLEMEGCLFIKMFILFFNYVIEVPIF